MLGFSPHLDKTACALRSITAMRWFATAKRPALRRFRCAPSQIAARLSGGLPTCRDPAGGPNVHRLRTCRWRGSAVVPLPARPPSSVQLSDKRLASAWLSSCSFLHTSPQAILACVKSCIALSRASSALSTAELASSSFSSNVFSFGILPPSHVRSVVRGASVRRLAPCTNRATRIVLMLSRVILDEAAKRGITCAL